MGRRKLSYRMIRLLNRLLDSCPISGSISMPHSRLHSADRNPSQPQVPHENVPAFCDTATAQKLYVNY